MAQNVCLQLVEKLFYQGRTLYIDNIYTGYDLAVSCLNRKTHIVGTLKNNKKFIPKTILHHKLRRGEIISKEDDERNCRTQMERYAGCKNFIYKTRSYYDIK